MERKRLGGQVGIVKALVAFSAVDDFYDMIIVLFKKSAIRRRREGGESRRESRRTNKKEEEAAYKSRQQDEEKEQDKPFRTLTAIGVECNRKSYARAKERIKESNQISAGAGERDVCYLRHSHPSSN